MIHKAKIYPGVCYAMRHNGEVVYTSKFTKWARLIIEHFAYYLIWKMPM